MKIGMLIIVVLITMIVLGRSLLKKQTSRVIPNLRDTREIELFRRSEVGNTLVRACGNCHSNQTILPWYGRVAPVSWWIHKHVREGREELNFSSWTTYSARRRRSELGSICGLILNGRMPPTSYRVLHPESRLQVQDKRTICAWAASESEHEN
jgi:hypothetical protein